MNQPKITTHTVYRALMFAAAVVAIYFCLPKEDGSRYIYYVNRPWSHALLTAPFDLPINLDSVRCQEVRDSIEANFEPVYTRDLTDENTAIAAYASRLNSTPGLPLSPLEKNRLLKEVRAIYDRGIVDSETYEQIRKGELPSVRIIHDNVAVSMPTSVYSSVRSAYSRLDSVFPDRHFHEAIAATRLSEMLVPNIRLDSTENTRLYNEVCQRAMAPIGVIQQGERIIDRGDIVTPQLYTILQTYETLMKERGSQGVVKDQYYPTLGKLLYLTILLASLYCFLYFFRRDYFDDLRRISFIMLCVVGFSIFAIIVADNITSGLYLCPFTMVPIVILIFLDSRTAFFSHIVTVLIALLVSLYPLELMFLQFAAGLTAIVSIKDLSKRSQLIMAALLVFGAYCLSFIAVETMQTGNLERISPRMFGYFVANAIFICFAYLLVFIIEKIFGFTSRVTLVELSDINHPVLRELSEECPGTFQHSMAVSNLASEAAHRIGANVQLVRAGALYHDIGKISNPAFFTENQHGVNPHDALDPLQSARVVISHVTEGIKRAEKAKLPQVIRDFILQHHGKGKAKYFYTTYCNAHPGEEVDPAPFTYPGPNPTTRETSILMMADSVEAASRSLSDHSPEAISSLVNKIIDGQIAEGLHNDSNISFRDVRKIKEVFISRLRTMYHSRIKYPTLIQPRPSADTTAKTDNPVQPDMADKPDKADKRVEILSDKAPSAANQPGSHT